MKTIYIKIFIIFSCTQVEITQSADQAKNQLATFDYNKRFLQVLRSTNIPEANLISYIQDLLHLRTTKDNLVVNLNLQDLQNNTPLILALKYNHPQTALLLLNQKNTQGKTLINIQHKNLLGETALDYAITTRSIAVTKRLIALGAQIQQHNFTQINNIQRIAIKKAFIKILVAYKNPFKKRSSKNNKKGSIFFKTLRHAYDEYQQLGHSDLLFSLLQNKEYQAYFKPEYVNLIIFDLQTNNNYNTPTHPTHNQIASLDIVANVDQNLDDITQLLNQI